MRSGRAEPCRRVEVRGVADVVDLTGEVTALVDGRYLHLEHEPHRPVTGPWKGPQHLAVEVVPQPEQAGLCRHQGVPKVLPPGGVGKVTGSHEADPLAPRPPSQMRQIAVAATGPAVLRMHMEIRVVTHRRILPCRGTGPVGEGRNSRIMTVVLPIVAPTATAGKERAHGTI